MRRSGAVLRVGMAALLAWGCAGASGALGTAAPRLRDDEPVELKPAFVKGDRWEWTLSAAETLSVLTAEVGGEPRETHSNALTVELRCTVLGASEADGERVQLSVQFGRTTLRARVSGDGPGMTVIEREGRPVAEDDRSDDGEGSSIGEPEPTGNGEDANIEATAKAALAMAVPDMLAGTVLRVDVDRDGRVLGYSGLESVYEATRQAGPDAARLLGPFAPGVIGRTLQLLLRVDEPSGAGSLMWAKRREGDTWESVEQTPLGPQGSLKCTTALRWVRTSAAGRGDGLIAELEGERTCGLIQAEGDVDPAVPRVSVDAQSQGSTARWSLTRGRLVSREVQTRVTSRAALGEGEGGQMGLVQRTMLVSTLSVSPSAEPAEPGSASPHP